MEQHISPESIQLIANLINNKIDDFDKISEERHKSLETKVRMIKTTVQENHKVSIEGRDFGKKTNGRVTRLENEVYGHLDVNGDKISGRDGILKDLSMVKRWEWFYNDWKIPVMMFVGATALYVKESRDFLIKIMDKII